MSAEPRYHVCVIGAGVAGALIAHRLAGKGLRTIVFDAGPRLEAAERPARMRRFLGGGDPWQLDGPLREISTSAGTWSYFLAGRRLRAVGGSTHHWGGVAFRRPEADFQMRRRHGIAEDWPIQYPELEPYYLEAERELGVSGEAGDPFGPPRSGDYPLPAFPFSYGDTAAFAPACGALGIRIHPVPYARNSQPYRGRPACQTYGTCHVCPIEAMYNGGVHVRMAEKTGRVRVVPDTSVLRLNEGLDGRIASVRYAGLDRLAREQEADVFVLAAHAVESARLLLLSRSERHPKGLANGNDLAGRYLMEHPATGVSGRVPQKLFPHRNGFYTAQSLQFYDTEERHRIGAMQLAFVSGGPTPGEIARRSSEWGLELKRRIRSDYGRWASVSAMVEQLPDRENRVRLDPKVRDYFGQPVPQIRLAVGDYEQRTLERARHIGSQILREMRAEIPRRGDPEFHGVSHHMGGCRMGSDPRHSVVDGNLRSHEHGNLFIVGSGAFSTGGAVPPTLTIAALALRAADHILVEFQRGMAA